MVDVDEDMAQKFIWNYFEVLIRKILLASNFEWQGLETEMVN